MLFCEPILYFGKRGDELFADFECCGAANFGKLRFNIVHMPALKGKIVECDFSQIFFGDLHAAIMPQRVESIRFWKVGYVETLEAFAFHFSHDG